MTESKWAGIADRLDLVWQGELTEDRRRIDLEALDDLEASQVDRAGDLIRQGRDRIPSPGALGRVALRGAVLAPFNRLALALLHFFPLSPSRPGPASRPHRGRRWSHSDRAPDRRGRRFLARAGGLWVRPGRGSPARTQRRAGPRSPWASIAVASSASSSSDRASNESDQAGPRRLQRPPVQRLVRSPMPTTRGSSSSAWTTRELERRQWQDPRRVRGRRGRGCLGRGETDRIDAGADRGDGHGPQHTPTK